MQNTCHKKPNSDAPFCALHNAPLIPLGYSDLRPNVFYYICSVARQIVQDPRELED